MRARCSAADGVGMGAGNRPHIHGSRSASSSDIARYLRLDRGLLDPEPTSSGEAIAFLTAPNSARVIAMTWKPFRGKRQFVRACLPLLTCLMLVLTSFAGMAHAADLAGGSIAGVEFTVHTAGDRDEVPSDSDKNVPHHHNYCHGHDVGAPARATMEYTLVLTAPEPTISASASLDGHTGIVHLRPPQA